ncbi:unnamed protein product [Rangifer tarandus platyrhynchus]|uniref:Uncharacterized protein n=2 Tax=Rangifer tarandus platyrhynchus TaxID=3082113 RepID=A0AC59YNI3_RANTA|nr:unnamed protein product [Rangifer tarandus platyrhynchus]
MRIYCMLTGLGWLSLTGGLGMLRSVKPPRNMKGSCTRLGDVGCEFGPVVRLEGGRHSKSWENFSKNKLSHSRGSFASSRESFDPSRKCICEDWEKFNPFYRWHVGEI